MSVREVLQPECRSVGCAPVAQVVEPREKDLDGFSVRRVLPAGAQKRVGPFIFFDHLGPSTFPAGVGMDVRPHPHIGLSTLTYLFAGAITHRDSLGFVQDIEPGAVNWMTAGAGIVHSERTPDALRAASFEMHGIQSWIGLPEPQEQVEPSFTHHPADSLPVIRREGASLTLVAGEVFGERSPVRTFSPLFYLYAEAQAGAEIPMPQQFAERAIYIVDGALEIAGERFAQHQMVVLAEGSRPEVAATETSRLMLLGGAPLPGDPTIWWNFSSGSQARIQAAQDLWREGGFPTVPGETEFIPLPE